MRLDIHGAPPTFLRKNLKVLKVLKEIQSHRQKNCHHLVRVCVSVCMYVFVSGLHPWCVSIDPKYTNMRCRACTAEKMKIFHWTKRDIAKFKKQAKQSHSEDSNNDDNSSASVHWGPTSVVQYKTTESPKSTRKSKATLEEDQLENALSQSLKDPIQMPVMLSSDLVTPYAPIETLPYDWATAHSNIDRDVRFWSTTNSMSSPTLEQRSLGRRAAKNMDIVAKTGFRGQFIETLLREEKWRLVAIAFGQEFPDIRHIAENCFAFLRGVCGMSRT